MTEQRCIYSGFNKCCADVSHTQHTLIIAVILIKKVHFHCALDFSFHGHGLSWLDGRVWGYQGNSRIQLNFWLFFSVFQLWANNRIFFIYAQYWRLINSEHWWRPMEWPAFHSVKGIQHYYITFCSNNSVSNVHNERWQRESLGALPCSRWPRTNPLGQIMQLRMASYSHQPVFLEPIKKA